MNIVARCVLVMCAMLSLNASVARAEVVVLSVGSDRSFDAQAKPLKYATKDATAFAATMKRYGAIPASSVTVERNPTISEFKDELASAIERLKVGANQAKNKFIFFFSGHADERGLHFKDGYFSKDLFDKFVAMLPAKTKVLIVDSCFAGMLTAKGVKPAQGFGFPNLNYDEPTGSIFLTAASGNDLAYESQQLGGGLFSRSIIEGLEGKADANDDGVVTATELYEYALRETRLTSRMISLPSEQNPEFVANLRGRGAVALSFPVLSTGQVHLNSDVGGKVNLYASNGLNVFEREKIKGSDDTFALPSGKYQLEVVDGEKKGLRQIRVDGAATTQVASRDIAWNSAPTLSSDGVSRGVESSVRAEPEQGKYSAQASFGFMGLGRYADWLVSLRKQASNDVAVPIFNLEFIRPGSSSGRNTDKEMNSAVFASIGVEKNLHEFSSLHLDGGLGTGLAMVSLTHGSGVFDSLLPGVYGEFKLASSSREFFVSAGYERLFPDDNSKTKIRNSSDDFVTTRVGYTHMF